jgi:cell fate regulator YaaT (PSP1 superfamily)
MAKEQSLSLNSNKISGVCGRLMCCLRYEHEAYVEEIKLTPPVDSVVKTPDGVGVVVETSPLRGLIKVKLKDTDGAPIQIHRDKVQVLSRPSRKSTDDDE